MLIGPKRLVDPDDLLTREESVFVSKSRREMREGMIWRINVHNAAAKQLEAIPPDWRIHTTRTTKILGFFLRNERTYK